MCSKENVDAHGARKAGTTNYGDQYMECPECGHTAEAECVDVGVGLYIDDQYMCRCGWNSAADGKLNVATYDDYFVEQV
tara:strand:- start:141784 stop:142020 length:237 start_codon:yes stop_codon:yes gene_type:complete